MFKFLVLCAFAAAAVAEPGALIGAPLATPLAYSPSFYTPATTTITKYATNVLPAAPYYGYNAPLAYSHFIKKRSAPLAFGSYYAPASYIAPAPLATAAYTAPILSRAPFYGSAVAYTAPAHFIKKRSVALPLPSTYFTPATYAAATPLLTSTYAAAAPIIPASPYIASTPFYSHLIKKRSAAIVASSYLSPAAYSTQSRFDFRAPFYSTYTTPLAYSRPIAYSQIY